MTVFYLAAAETQTSKGLFESLGIDIQLIIVQLVSFLILFLILKRFVYPTFIKSIDSRQMKIEESLKAAEEANKAAIQAGQNTEEAMKQARKEAADIVSLAQKEAAKVVEDAEQKASKKADHILEQAEARIHSDISAAKQSLRSEMIELVTSATEKVIEQKLDAASDRQLIKKALEETR